MIHVAEGALVKFEGHENPEEVHERLLEMLDSDKLLHRHARRLAQPKLVQVLTFRSSKQMPSAWFPAFIESSLLELTFPSRSTSVD